MRYWHCMGHGLGRKSRKEKCLRKGYLWGMKRRYFSKEYKEKVVLESYKVKCIKALAAELGISPALLYT